MARGAAACVALALVGAAARISARGPAFLAPANLRGSGAAPAAAPAQRSAPAVALEAESSAMGAGSLWAMAVGAVVATRAVRQTKTNSAFAGNAGAAVVGVSGPRLGDAAEGESVIACGGVKRRPHVRISERTHKEWMRMRRRNSAALKRFLIRPDGTIWRKQSGLRHLKSKKSPAHLKRLAKMVRITRGEYRRVELLTGKRPPTPKPEDYIMRKFNEARHASHLGMSDRGVGTSMWS